MAPEQKIEVTRGSANVFADIGMPDAEEHLLKVQLVTQVTDIIKKRQLTQKGAGAVMGLKQPDVSKLLRGQFRGYSIGRLLEFLVALGHDVEIVVKRKARTKRPARMSVKAA